MMEISVQAWRCKECSTTTDSHRAKVVCESQGHSLTLITAKKTRWECRSCHTDVFVLDRELPLQCTKCNTNAWKQGPLRRVAKAAMERDFLMPRGEELPFLNSICKSNFGPGAQAGGKAYHKEPKDDYEGL